MATDPAPPDWHSHGLNRVAGLLFARALPAERRAVRGNLSRVLAGSPPAALASVVATLERIVRAYPTQWFNFFDVWSPPHGLA